MTSYTIIQVNTNGYDTPFPCKSNDSENLLFTDIEQPIDGWKCISIKPSSNPFNDVFSIRWNPFKYADTDYVVWIDGSFRINKSLRKLIDIMDFNSYELAIVKHPYRNNVFDEYAEWCRIRNYDKIHAFRWLHHMEVNGFDVTLDGTLYQAGIIIFKNCDKIKEFCECMMKELHTFDKDNFERLDQTVASFVLGSKFNYIKLLGLPNIMNSEFLTLNYNHPCN